MADFYYTSKKDCIICERKFTVTRVRGRWSVVRQDSDFCTVYNDLNPNYYSIYVCPHCGYAARDVYFDELMPAQIEKMKKFLESRTVNVDFGGQRTREQAIATYKLAIFYAEMLGIAASKIAGLYLRLAWIFREGEQENEEKAALKKACEYFDKALLKERFPIGEMTELRVEYLIGDLLRRTEQYDRALLYLSKVVSNPRAKEERRVYELARTVWQETREAKKLLENSSQEDEEIAN